MSEKHNLVKAIKTNDWKKVETLLEKYPKLLNTELDDYNHLWYHNMANKTIDTENTENIILKLCTKYKEFVDLERKNSAGATPLLLAVLNGKFYQTRAFLKLGSDISTRDYHNIGLRDKCCRSSVANMKNKKNSSCVYSSSAHPNQYHEHRSKIRGTVVIVVM